MGLLNYIRLHFHLMWSVFTHGGRDKAISEVAARDRAQYFVNAAHNINNIKQLEAVCSSVHLL